MLSSCQRLKVRMQALSQEDFSGSNYPEVIYLYRRTFVVYKLCFFLIEMQKKGGSVVLLMMTS